MTPSQDVAIGRQCEVQTEGLFIRTVTSVKTDSAWFSTITVGGSSDKFKLDTGAEANVLPLIVSTGPPLAEAVIPPVSATPTVPVSNAELALPVANESSPLPTQAKCTSSGRNVRLPERYKDYVMN
ncbi:hypothetical protein P5673_028551 [Acropora cervicornis]|uniref:Uncharacterized protein n=1 Tax=Acropora cervicornis TaxID=6130 RepID=A0AAD9UUR3_ACRCE|nr:hypothetical protein P5673_028551 [Acropora cervicornis]